MTNCDMTECTETFWISRPYWLDGEEPTVRNEEPSSPTAFTNCRDDMFCSTRTVQGYMRKFKKDCNNDGEINCDDYFAIHFLGGYGCTGNIIEPYATRYRTCKRIVKSFSKNFVL